MVDSFERLFHELLALPLQIEHPLAHHDVGAESSDSERAGGDRSEHQPVHHSTSTSSCLPWSMPGPWASRRHGERPSASPSSPESPTAGWQGMESGNGTVT